jgi:hypothetical protein
VILLISSLVPSCKSSKFTVKSNIDCLLGFANTNSIDSSTKSTQEPESEKAANAVNRRFAQDVESWKLLSITMGLPEEIKTLVKSHLDLRPKAENEPQAQQLEQLKELINFLRWIRGIGSSSFEFGRRCKVRLPSTIAVAYALMDIGVKLQVGSWDQFVEKNCVIVDLSSRVQHNQEIYDALAGRLGEPPKKIGAEDWSSW